MNKRIAVVGDCSTDHFLVVDAKDIGIIHADSNKEKICFNYGQKIPVGKVYNSNGGSALNVATSFANFPLDVDLCTFVGKDFEGREIIGHLHACEIGNDQVIIDQQTNQSFIILFDEERTVLSNHLPRPYSRLIIPKADYIYLASCGEGSEDLVNNIRSALAQGSRLIMNPGSYTLHHFDYFRGLLKDSVALILNREEADELFGLSNIKNQLEKILELGTNLVVITDGKNGAYFASDGQFYHMHAEVSEVIDPTGAGDAFASTMIAAMILDQPIEEAAKWGMINAASVISHYGSTNGLLGMAEIDKKTKSNKILKFSPL